MDDRVPSGRERHKKVIKVARMLMALMGFSEYVHHGQIVIHVGAGDIRVEESKHYKEVERLVIDKSPP